MYSFPRWFLVVLAVCIVAVSGTYVYKSFEPEPRTGQVQSTIIGDIGD